MEGDDTAVVTKVDGEWEIASHMTTGPPKTRADPGKPSAMV